jgi:hypothetical protein
LWDYTLRFSRNCHELPKICAADVILAFWSGTNCRTLVHELYRDQPKPRRSFSKLPPGMPLARRQSEPFSSRVVGRWALAVVKGHHPRQPTRAQKGVPEATRGG